MELLDQLQQSLGDDYAIERELGGGGMSRVFVAQDRALARRVVIKLLSPELAEGLSAERFLREIRVAASLQQANIVPVLWTGSAGLLPYYVMPYVEGESLRQRLEAGPLPLHEVIGTMRDVARALAHAHARGIVHRDIKPDNVLVSGGAAVVTDFGIAKAISAARVSAGATLTQVGTSIGTPAYMAPEQAAGDPEVDHRADLYALGCVAYELLAGRPLFPGLTAQRTLAAQITNDATAIASLRPDCPSRLASLVMQLLRKDPAQRPQSATEVLAAIDGMAIGDVVPAAKPPASAQRLVLTLALYAIAFAGIVLVTRAAVSAIGLPDWVVPGVIVVLSAGLPALLATAYVQRVAHDAQSADAAPGAPRTRRSSGVAASMALRASPHVSWRRTMRGGYYALAGFVLVVAAFMGMRALGIGPAGTLFAAGSLKSDDKLLVSGFTFSTPADSALGPILTEGVMNALGQSRAVKLLEPATVAKVLGQMTRKGDIAGNDSVAREVAERAGASAIVSGRIAHSTGDYLVSLSLRRASDGAMLASFQQAAGGTRELIDVTDALTRRLRGKIGESLRTVNRSVPLAQATTSSLEALRKYSEGSRANDVDNDYERAVVLLREAVTIDSTFALAWRKLGTALGNARYPRPARDSAFERALRYSGRLPDRERGLVLGAYYAARDRRRAIAGYELAYAADTDNFTAVQQLASLYSVMRDAPHSLRYGRRSLALSRDPSTAAAVALLLVRSGDARGGQAILDSLGRSGATLDDLSLYQSASVTAAYARDRIDSIRPIAERMMRSGNPRVHLDGVVAAQLDALLRGQLSRAENLQEALPRRRVDGPTLFPLDTINMIELDIAYERSPARAIRRLDALVASPAYLALRPAERQVLRVASAYARAGAPAKARLLVSRADSTMVGSRGPSYVQAEIALAEGRYAEAERAARAADADRDGTPTTCAACTPLQLARIFAAAGQPDSAIASLERYFAIPAGRRWDTSNEGINRPLAEKRLGELYDARGDRAKAVAHYTNFVELWKDADPPLRPAVDAARQRLRQIAAREGR